jgi:VCBS repeat-containing protein
VVGAPTASTNGYGSFTITADGAWTYTLDNTNPVVQAVPAGGTLTDSFTVATIDGTEQVVTITITGTNDAPVAVADDNAGDAVSESGISPGNVPFAGDPAAAGNVLANDTDVDTGGTVTVTAVNGSAANLGIAVVGLYGALTLAADGSWSYVLDNADPDTDALAQDQAATDSFTYTIEDASGATATTTLTIAITGTNDAPVVTGAVDNGTVEEGPLAVMVADGTIDFGDVDLTDAHITAVTPGASGYLGIFAADVTNASTGDGVGQVTWLFAANNALREAALNDETLVQTYTVVLDDGHGGTVSQLVTITIIGTNDAAVITGDTTGAVTEAGGIDNGTPGTPTATGNLDSTDVDDPDDSWTVVGNPATPVASTNGYGSYTITSNGTWNYTLDNTNPTVHALPSGGTLTDTFTAETIDGTEQVVTITITGANDAPVVTGAVDNGTVTEGSLPVMVAEGTIDFGDVDLTDAHVTAVTPGASGYFGTFAADVTNASTGDGVGQVSWLFEADNVLRTSLAAGQVLVQTYTVEIDDGHGGTVSQLVTITINGTNDAAVITGDAAGAVVEAGGVANAIPGIPTDTGNLDATDVDDDPDDSWTVVGTPIASSNGYGSFTITADGVWSYTLDNTDPAVQALNGSATLTDSFTVATIDGTEQIVTITITGANDAPAAVADSNAGDAVIESGISSGNIPFAGDPSAAGNVLANDTDVDSGDTRTVTAVNGSAANLGIAIAGLYGALTLSADGTWSYVLENADPDTDALALGQAPTEAFTYTITDASGATATTTLTITIAGTNDAPVVTGAVDNGTVTEGSLPVMVAEGTIDFGDVDLTDAHVTAVTPGADGYLGTFVTEVTNASTGDGVGQVSWLFEANNVLRTSLAAGQVLVQTYTVVIDDGHGGTASQLVTITINGTNDAAVITGDTTGAVVEAGGVANAIPGTPTDTGNLDATDVDDPADSWTVVGIPTASSNGYGSFTITADGVWSYTLDNTNPTVQGLNGSATLTDSFTVATIDGTEQVVTITITGANDAPVAVADSNAGDEVSESGISVEKIPFAGDPSATGNVLTNDTDVDSGDTRTVTAVNGSAANLGIAIAGLYGALTLAADGSWSYLLDNTDPDTEALVRGQAATEAFTYTMTDANGATSSAALIITIHGTNDAPVAVDDTNAGDAVIESGVNPGNTPFAGDPSAAGNVLANDTDVDAGDTRTVTALNGSPAEVGVPIRGTFGEITLSADGNWTYILDNEDPDTEALAEGATGVGMFTYTITDANGATSTATLAVTIIGTNDQPTAVPDHNIGVVGATDPTATGNVLTNDIDPDSGDTRTVIAVSGAAASVNQIVVGVYGTLIINSSGAWTYTLDTSDPDTLALPPDETAVDTFAYTMGDAVGATSTTTLDITVSGGVVPPYINTSTHNFVTPSEPGQLVFINGFTFQDIDSPASVTVRISSTFFQDVLFASTLGGVFVSGSGTSSLLLTGSIADINAYISGNNVRWDPPAGDFDRNFTVTIDDNGSFFGGAVVTTTLFFNDRSLAFSDFGPDNVNLAGWDLNNVAVDLGFGFANDTVVTAWSHGPFATDIRYLGGDGFDTITLVFTPAQLEAILSNSFDRGELQDYLDGDVGNPFGDDTLSLGGTSWNATVTDFESASLALAAGPDGFIRFNAIGDNLPDFDVFPDFTDDTFVGTTGNDTVSGLEGNDILVGRGGTDTLNGDTGSDMLLGGSGNDWLRGGLGNDILAGGVGADLFIFANTGVLNSDSVVDFSYVDGDSIDLSALLDPGFSTGQPISGFVQALQSGSDIIVQVDTNGGGDSFAAVATLTGYGTVSEDLVRVRFEGTDHTVLV